MIPTFTYEQSVHWLRTQAEHSELIELSYLDADNFVAATRFASSEEFAEIKNILGLNKSSKKLKILDLGCGNGIAAYAFASLGHDVTAVDPDLSEDVGLGATKRLGSVVQHGSISTFQSFAESLPFSNSTFDIVYTRQALHHFSDLYKGIAECSRVLNSRGLLLATREHVVDDENQLQEFLANHTMHQLHGGENAHSLKEYISAIQSASFRNIKVFSPFDTVINHFPISNTDIKTSLYQSLKKQLGVYGASFLAKIPMTESFYRNYLSWKCNYPGRLYSFVCFK